MIPGRPKVCDHKFVDSPNCLKCGWVPPVRGVVVRRLSEEQRKELRDYVRFIQGPRQPDEPTDFDARIAARSAIGRERYPWAAQHFRASSSGEEETQ